MPPAHIVLLGSSFASGSGIEPIIDKAAGRSTRNYGCQLASRLNASVTDLSASGSTLANILDQNQESGGGRADHVLPPQLTRLPPDADLVLITSGGNDLGYAMGMMSDSAVASARRDGNARRLNASPPPVTRQQAEHVTAGFVRIIDQVRQRAPGAAIYLVSYLAVFGDASLGSESTPLDQRGIDHFVDVADTLAAATQEAARRRPGVEFVPIHELSKGHEIGSSEPWVSGYADDVLKSTAVPYHPLEAGHSAVANELHQRVLTSSVR